MIFLKEFWSPYRRGSAADFSVPLHVLSRNLENGVFGRDSQVAMPPIRLRSALLILLAVRQS